MPDLIVQWIIGLYIVGAASTMLGLWYTVFRSREGRQVEEVRALSRNPDTAIPGMIVAGLVWPWTLWAIFTT